MNLVIIVADTLRRDYLGCYGNKWIRTPNLDRLAKESVIFDNAYAEGLPTIPFRRALHTGCRTFPFDDYPGPRKGDMVKTAGWQPLAESDVTLSEILSDNGYICGFITDTYHQFKPSMNFHRGFDSFLWIRGQEADRYETGPLKKVDINPYLKSRIRKSPWGTPLIKRYLKNISFRKEEKDYFAPLVFGEGIKWIEKNRDTKDFFLLLDSFDPHEPWDPPQKYIDLYNPGYKGKEIILPIGHDSGYLTEKEMEYIRALYAGEVTMFDRWLGKFLKRLNSLGLKQKTLIVFVSDHGTILGERGIIKKYPSELYSEVTDLPFLVRHPRGVFGGKRVAGFVQNHDILPTVLHLLGIKYRGRVDGKNIWPLVTEEKKRVRGHATCCYGSLLRNNYYSVKTENYLCIRSGDGKDVRLHDLKKDPAQLNNIAGSFPAAVKKMEKLLKEEIRRYGKSRRKKKC